MLINGGAALLEANDEATAVVGVLRLRGQVSGDGRSGVDGFHQWQVEDIRVDVARKVRALRDWAEGRGRVEASCCGANQQEDRTLRAQARRWSLLGL